MHKRSAHRLRIAIIFMVATAFALGSFWLVQLMNNSTGEVQPDQRKNEPDYIVEQFSFVRMTPNGQPRYILSGSKLTHRPIDDASDVEQPVMQSISADQAPMTVHALRARVDHANSQVHLSGDVHVERAASPNSKAMSLKTQKLTLLSDDEQMTSDQAVEMRLGSSVLTGVGLQANNATRRMQLGKGQLINPPRAQN